MTYQPPKCDPRQFLGMTHQDLNGLQGLQTEPRVCLVAMGGS